MLERTTKELDQYEKYGALIQEDGKESIRLGCNGAIVEPYPKRPFNLNPFYQRRKKWKDEKSRIRKKRKKSKKHKHISR